MGWVGRFEASERFIGTLFLKVAVTVCVDLGLVGRLVYGV